VAHQQPCDDYRCRACAARGVRAAPSAADAAALAIAVAARSQAAGGASRMPSLWLARQGRSLSLRPARHPHRWRGQVDLGLGAQLASSRIRLRADVHAARAVETIAGWRFQHVLR
jgi:hypothetical protein